MPELHSHDFGPVKVDPTVAERATRAVLLRVQDGRLPLADALCALQALGLVDSGGSPKPRRLENRTSRHRTPRPRH